LSRDLRSLCRDGNFVPLENLHLTLAFLGECSGECVSAALAAVSNVAFEPFNVQVESVGRFKRDGGDVWWAGVRECAPLVDLQRDLTNALVAKGFALEERRFKPHITLARKVPAGPRAWPVEPFGETVHRIDLMESKHVGGLLVYAVVCEMPLS